MKSPTNLDDVNQRIVSEEGRILSAPKIRALIPLVHEICRTRSVRLQWGLTCVVLTKRLENLPQFRTDDDGSI